MDAIVEATPDTGEGGRWHLRAEFAWETREDYNRAAEGDESILSFYEDGLTLDDVKAANVRDAAKAVARWLEEDKADG